MSRVLALPALVCVCSSTACFNPPSTPLATETTTGPATSEDTLDSTTSSVEPTTGPDPDTTVGPSESTSTSSSTSTDTGETTTAGGTPEIEVSIDGMVIETGESFELANIVAVDAFGLAVTVTVTNTGTGDLLVGGVLPVGPAAAHVIVDQSGLAATIAAGDASTFTATFAPINGGLKDIVLRISSNDDDENPYDVGLRGHTNENSYRLLMPMGPTPSARFNMGFEDLRDGRILMFGGRDAPGAWLGDTWIYDIDDNAWTPLGPGMSPPIRNAHDMVLVDADTVVMFGGSNAQNGGALGDTWIFDVPTETWSPLPVMGPSARFQHNMVAIGDDQVLLYGGRTANAGTELNDTWIFDGATQTWSPANPSGNPPVNSSFALAFDGVDGVTMFGGFQSNNPISQTWRYAISTNSWGQVLTMGSPGARAVLDGRYLAQDRMIVFSGKLNDCCVNPSPGTFAFDPAANAWATITPPGEPAPRFSYGVTDVVGGNKMIVFGGLLLNGGPSSAVGQLWEYVGPRP